MEYETSYHWPLMVRAIEHLDRADGPAMSLEEIAAEVNLSPAHFQRMFSRWIGVSPKRFQQYLRLGHAKRLLEARFSTLATADAVGLSGSGRLHDLFVRWDAMSPGDYARKGAGLAIRWAYAEGPFGRMLGMATDRGLAGLAFCDEVGDAAAMADLSARWPNADLIEDAAALAPHFSAAFGTGEARVHLIGAPFQIKVWEALMAIPSGHVTTYGEIAAAVGRPRAHRAVGTAVGRNPIGWIIPCHRALRADGALGGYHWGLAVKRGMLAVESARSGFPPPDEA